MINLSSTQRLRLSILLYSMIFIGFLVWTFIDKSASCKVLVISENSEAISYTHGTQQDVQIVSIALNNPFQKLFLNNYGTSKIYRSDGIVFILLFSIFSCIMSYFQVFENANPFHKTIDNLLRGLFIFLSVYLLCKELFFIEHYNVFIDAHLPEGLQQYKPHDTNFLVFFFILPILHIYKFMIEKGRTYKEEIEMVV